MSMRYSEALPRMEAGEVFECEDGYAYRVKGGRLEFRDPQCPDDKNNYNWATCDLPYHELEEYVFNTPLAISDKAWELAKEEEEKNNCYTQIPCAACLTVRMKCVKRDMDCPSFTTAYGMQVMLNWLAGHGVKEGSSC